MIYKIPPEEEIKFHKQEIKSIKRKIRSDIGLSRPIYDSKVPPKFKSYIARANKKQLNFELTVEDFTNIINHPCIYCGTNSKIGIDRIECSQGYTKDNCQPCCGQCNVMKFTHSHYEFIKIIEKIYKFQTQKY